MKTLSLNPSSQTFPSHAGVKALADVNLPLAAFNDDLCYAALKARDARFDGSFFVGVTSTGIYCRPICRVRLPKRENCRFFSHAAVAEGLGFRACLRCRPAASSTTAPTSASIQAVRWSAEDASATLAAQALQLMFHQAGAEPVAEVAQKMGISERHLRRIFGAHWGLSPLAYVRALRALKAQSSTVKLSAQAQQPIKLKLNLEAPFEAKAMLEFLSQRALPGLECVDAQGRYWRSLRVKQGAKIHRGWICADLGALINEAQQAQQAQQTEAYLTLSLSVELLPVLPQVVAMARAAFDLDAPIALIDASLLTHFPNSSGQRVPGCFDGFELAVRAILGQQITVQAARTLATRLLEAAGERLTVNAADAPLSRCFPSPAQLLRLGAQTLGELGIVKQRQAALLGLAQAVLNGLDLSVRPRQADELQACREALRAIPGIGEWTTQYIALRALREPDVWLAGDVALQIALGVRGTSPSASAKAAAAASLAWQPWRSHAVIRAWAGFNQQQAAVNSSKQKQSKPPKSSQPFKQQKVQVN
jgi:AraC family transcriptional regulator, regulatory protein of adaptative response / DNA-3-methyladenine glycosylase II